MKAKLTPRVLRKTVERTRRVTDLTKSVIYSVLMGGCMVSAAVWHALYFWFAALGFVCFLLSYMHYRRAARNEKSQDEE